MRNCQIQCNFGGTDDLCKLGKEYLTALTCKLWRIKYVCMYVIMHFIQDKILKLLTYYTPFYRIVVAKLSDLKNSPVFWPTLYISTSYELQKSINR